jgi:hypothetical protein
MKDSKSFSEKGKEKTTSPVKTRDFTRAHSQEKLTLNPQRDILKGGSGQEESSSQQQETSSSNLSAFRSKLDRFNENKENKSRRYNEALRIGEKLYEFRINQEQSKKAEEQAKKYYQNYSDNHGGFRHYR